MTVQEILLLDSSADIRVGVAKLQQILNTMRMFRDERDALEAEVAVLSRTSDALEASVARQREEKLVWAKRYNDAKHELAELKVAYNDLANTKLRVGAIDITLDDL